MTQSPTALREALLVVCRAGDLLDAYGEYIGTVKADDLERHPYLPDVEDTVRGLRDLAALLAQPPALPDGWVMVPREPVREMWAAGGDAVVGYRQRHHDKVVADIWSAMLAAAPTPPASPAPDTSALVEDSHDFTRGYLIAVSNLVGLHGSEVEARDLLTELGAVPNISLFDFTEYDQANLVPLFVEMKRRAALAHRAAPQPAADEVAK